MFCHNCGCPDVDGAAFCPNCGARLMQADPSGENRKSQGMSNDSPGETALTVVVHQTEKETSTDGSEEKSTGPRDAAPGTSGMEDRESGNTEKPPGMQTAERVIAMIAAILYGLGAIVKLTGIFPALFLILNGGTVSGLLLLLQALFLLLGFVLMTAALIFTFLRMNFKRNTAGPLLLITASAGILQIIAAVLAYVISLIRIRLAESSFNILSKLSLNARYSSMSVTTVGLIAAAALLTVVILLIPVVLGGESPFEGMTAQQLKEDLLGLPSWMQREIDEMKWEKQYKKNGNGGSIDDYRAEEKSGPVRLDENRGLLKYFLLGLVTCGIYALYTYYAMARDINIACDEDGEKTPGLVKYILLTLVTCSIYHFVWHYKFMNRIQRASERHGFKVKTFSGMDLGSCWLVFTLVGMLVSVCGIGFVLTLYAMHLVFANMNNLARYYNNAVFGEGNE